MTSEFVLAMTVANVTDLSEGTGGYNWAPNGTVILTDNGIATTPLPAALPLFASGLGAFGLLGWRRKKKAAALAA